MSANAAIRYEFGPAVLHGLLEYGPFDTELSLELGLSLWLHRSATTPADACSAMLALRTALVDVSGIDPKSEPFPLIGRAPERDLVNLANYLGTLVTRAASAVGCEPKVLAERAISLL